MGGEYIVNNSQYYLLLLPYYSLFFTWGPAWDDGEGFGDEASIAGGWDILQRDGIRRPLGAPLLWQAVAGVQPEVVGLRRARVVEDQGLQGLLEGRRESKGEILQWQWEQSMGEEWWRRIKWIQMDSNGFKWVIFQWKLTIRNKKRIGPDRMIKMFCCLLAPFFLMPSLTIPIPSPEFFAMASGGRIQ